MGFLDRLEQERATETHRQEQLKAPEMDAKKTKLQEKFEGLERRASKLGQAQRFQEESGIIKLLARLSRIIPGASISVGYACKQGWDWWYEGGPNVDLNTLDPKIVTRVDGVKGSDSHIRVETSPDGTIDFVGGPNGVEETRPELLPKPMTVFEKIRGAVFGYSAKLTPVSYLSDPCSQVLIKSIPRVDWVKNPNILEESLEEVFRTPYYIPSGPYEY